MENENDGLAEFFPPFLGMCTYMSGCMPPLCSVSADALLWCKIPQASCIGGKSLVPLFSEQHTILGALFGRKIVMLCVLITVQQWGSLHQTFRGNSPWLRQAICKWQLQQSGQNFAQNGQSETADSRAVFTH